MCVCVRAHTLLGLELGRCGCMVGHAFTCSTFPFPSLPLFHLNRLFTKGIILGYRRGQRKQHPHTSLVRLEGVDRKENTDFYLGKKLAYVYRAHKKSKAKGAKKPSKYRVIWGKVTRPHGNSGVVRAKFTRNLPPKTFGATVRVVSA